MSGSNHLMHEHKQTCPVRKPTIGILFILLVILGAIAYLAYRHMKSKSKAQPRKSNMRTHASQNRARMHRHGKEHHSPQKGEHSPRASTAPRSPGKNDSVLDSGSGSVSEAETPGRDAHAGMKADAATSGAPILDKYKSLFPNLNTDEYRQLSDNLKQAFAPEAGSPGTAA